MKSILICKSIGIDFLRLLEMVHFGKNIWNKKNISFLVETYTWYGYNFNWPYFGQVRARAWKAESLPSPDVEDTTHVLRANTSAGNET